MFCQEKSRRASDYKNRSKATKYSILNSKLLTLNFNDFPYLTFRLLYLVIKRL